MTERLTPLRLFSTPSLHGASPTDLKFSPDGSFLTYRRAADDDRERMEVWKIDPVSGVHSLFLDPRKLGIDGADVTAMTSEERAERERRRQFSHGVTQYHWHPDGRRLLVPMDGQALLVTPDTTAMSIARLCPEETRQSGFQLSPQGNFLSYVREGNLYITHLVDGRERQLTDDANEVVTYGLPDFLAAEEMHRFTGHWWSPDEHWVVFTRVDETPVEVSHRLEMEADGARIIEQRYPYAGKTNPDVELWLYDMQEERSRRIWRTCPAQTYLARVHMRPGRILIQTQDRLQHCLTLSVLEVESDQWRELFREVSNTWINLNDDLQLLPDDGILVTSEHGGTRCAIRLDANGTQTPLAGPAHINKVLAHDADTVWVSGWHDSPLDNHLFAIALNGKGFNQLTSQAGWHDCVVETRSARFLDHFNSHRTPPQITLYDLSTPDEGIEIYREEFNAQHPYTPFLALHSYPSFGELEAEDGQRIYYRLTPPADLKGSHPTIVYVYGGPGPQKARREWGPLLVQLFTQHGFAVLELDNRGSGNRGREFEAPIYRRMGSVEVADQVAGLRALDSHTWADKSRVGIFGHSYGGYLTLMCLTRAAEHFRAGAAVAPVSDWSLYDTHYTERYMGLPQDNIDGYRDGNVLTHLHKLDAPLLLMHGMADDNVLFTHSTMLMARLQHLGKPFELMTYPGAKHSMQEREVSIHRFDMILDFFKRHL